MKVTITQQHIDQGKRGQHDKCPLALALQEATDQPYRVGGSYYWIMGEGERREARKMSARALDFIRQFDTGGAVSPGEIELDF